MAWDTQIQRNLRTKPAWSIQLETLPSATQSQILTSNAIGVLSASGFNWGPEDALGATGLAVAGLVSVVLLAARTSASLLDARI